jgi:uncharacterized protein (TIGR03083 family)
MNTPLDHVQIVWAEAQQLIRYLHALPPAAWHCPSACERWQVSDVVVHLAICAEFYAGSICRGLQGDTTPPPGFSPPGVDMATAAERIAQGAITRRQHLGDQVLATFTSATERLHHLLSHLGPQAWELPCYHPARVRPVRSFVDMWMHELAMHGWDIHSRLEPSAHVSAESLLIFMETIPRTLHGKGLADARLPVPVRARFMLTGVAGRRVDLVLDTAAASLEAAGESPAHLHCCCDAETFVLLLYGRLRLAAVIASGRVVSESDPALLTIVDEWFTGG